MDALILSCSTGGGHNAAAYAIQEAFTLWGHHAVVLDPYSLVGQRLEKMVGNGYIRIAQRTPQLFGAIYKLGDAYRRLPIHSPVYAVNKIMRRRMSDYLKNNRYDVIFTTHVYPGEMLAALKNSGAVLPKCIFVATDYVCVPFTEETKCDYFVTPSELLCDDFVGRGIPKDKLLPFGIPVKSAFSENISRDEAKARLGLDKEKGYLLVSGGSIGAGLIEKTLTVLSRYMKTRAETATIIICGNNGLLYERTVQKYGGDARFKIISTTDKMHLYMKACDAFITKPGGLSSTEAAVANAPTVHISPIPGCENMNMQYFSSHGMSIAVGDRIEELPSALMRLNDEAFVQKMRDNQDRFVNKNSSRDLCEFAETLLSQP